MQHDGDMSVGTDDGGRWERSRDPNGRGHWRSHPEEPAPRDGRAARAVRTRKAVADALLNLIEEGDLRPTSKSIARRAGVSERTIFQHFDDLETLFSVAAERVGDRIVGNLKQLSDDAPFAQRLSDYMDELLYLHEAMTSVRRASRLHEPFSPVIDRALGWWRDALRRGIERVFAPELEQWSGDEQRDVLEALAVIATWSSWENMRRHSGFSPERARRVLELSFCAVLRQPPPCDDGVPGESELEPTS